ncbi:MULTISPECIES: DUF4298 domain-containing protein [Nosocomiicoccus]|uniref:DUF4298 domain-containing protein n=1 Tax=Nosocomiicoccus massiliensis TaxID=1232430 RepID=A0AAF0YQP0_9STAP|nr:MULTISPECIES: DUF4298 domain-containing protein [Nosocomiicoccus]OFL48704.1 hypothetical protein HMPREF2767_07380 [Nosocomiicoccus sp. HMSC067E10]OFO53217.1 hypothetical protein HMPREF3029_05965 [Nosocomiicoccus sp. HMSC059G07]WOS96856.1 DUF4298 domain-containing protein [Nosocomiicoccus massiliensis]
MKKDVIRYEEILNRSADLKDEMQNLLQKFEENLDEYNALKNYYGSQEYLNDLEVSNTTDEYDDINQGVLSEDAVFNLIGEMYHLNVDMLEIAAKYLRTH